MARDWDDSEPNGPWQNLPSTDTPVPAGWFTAVDEQMEDLADGTTGRVKVLEEKLPAGQVPVTLPEGATAAVGRLLSVGGVSPATFDLIEPVPAPQIDVFDIAGTWTWVKPAGAKSVTVTTISGGGGGGGGRRGAAASARFGGGAGASGATSRADFRASDLPSSLTVTVGAGGTAGAAATTDDTSGGNGGDGQNSSFGGYVKTAFGGKGGLGGTTTSGTAGAAAVNAGGVGQSLQGGVSNAGAGSAGAGQGAVAAAIGQWTGCGGGGGGGISAADVPGAGGPGGVPAYTGFTGNASGGVVGGATPNSAAAQIKPGMGSGGGGGAASITGPAQAGASGGAWAGGAGGGGASLNGNNSGAGGVGGTGAVVVITHFDRPALLADQWVAAGDSLTAGAGGGGTTYPGVLATALGKSVLNQGVGGETAPEIAGRLGAAPVTVTVPGGSIPATGPVTVVPSPSIPTAQGVPIWGRLAGIPGVLTLSGGTITFTRSEAGSGSTAVSGALTFVPDLAGPLSYYSRLIWVGRNGVGGGNMQVAPAARALADQCRTGRYLVLSVINGTGEGTGTSGHSNVTIINGTLIDAFGDRYLDIRRHLIDNGLSLAGITPTTQDNADVAADTVPVSLRTDNIHLTAAGYTVVANAVRTKLQALGWA